jgi:hypothetical protein
VFEQQKPDDELRVLGRPPKIWGKGFLVFDFQVLPRDELLDPKPAVSLIKPAAEGKKLGKKGLGFTVFGKIHGPKLLGKVQGFWGPDRENRAFRT